VEKDATGRVIAALFESIAGTAKVQKTGRLKGRLDPRKKGRACLMTKFWAEDSLSNKTEPKRQQLERGCNFRMSLVTRERG
jgi:hypothetical protein